MTTDYADTKSLQAATLLLLQAVTKVDSRVGMQNPEVLLLPSSAAGATERDDWTEVEADLLGSAAYSGLVGRLRVLAALLDDIAGTTRFCRRFGGRRVKTKLVDMRWQLVLDTQADELRVRVEQPEYTKAWIAMQLLGVESGLFGNELGRGVRARRGYRRAAH